MNLSLGYFLKLNRYAGHTDVLKVLIQRGGMINKEGEMRRTPLHEACARGNVQCASLLVQKGATIR